MLETTTSTSAGWGNGSLPPRHTPRAVPAPAAARHSDLEGRFEREAVPHMQALYAGAYRLVRNAADAEDLVQETYLRAFRAFHLYTPGTNIRAWLFTILYRARADYYRKVARSPQTVELVHDGPAVAPPQDQLAGGQEEVLRALDRLPEGFRGAVVLRDMQDFSYDYDEIAGILQIPIGTVMSRIHRGRSLLRGMLQGVQGAQA
jgi:RNA polymerase sigma-70 factor (ECF subfamily)